MDIFSRIVKEGIILDQGDIATLRDTNMNMKYNYTKNDKCRRFTLLHKLVLLTNKHKKLINIIKEYIRLYPKEVNKVNEYGWNALQLASANSNCWSSIETVKLLMSYSAADIKTKTKKWVPALMLASKYSASYSSIETVKLLLMSCVENNADINIKNSDGETALMLASINSSFHYFYNCSNIETVKLLLEYDAVPHDKFSNLVNNIKLLNTLS